MSSNTSLSQSLPTHTHTHAFGEKMLDESKSASPILKAMEDNERNVGRPASSFETIRNMFEKAQSVVNWFYGANETVEPNRKTQVVLPSKIVKSNVEFFEAICNKVNTKPDRIEKEKENSEVNDLPQEVTLRKTKTLSLSSSSFSSFRSSTASTADSSYDTGTENNIVLENKQKTLTNVNRDDSILRHFDRFYSRIEENRKSIELANDSCKSPPDNQSVEEQTKLTHAPLTNVTVKIHKSIKVKVNNHRVNLGRHRRLRSSSASRNCKTAKKVAPLVDLKMEQLMESGEDRIYDYRFHLFSDQLAYIIQLLNRYSHDNQASNDAQVQPETTRDPPPDLSNCDLKKTPESIKCTTIRRSRSLWNKKKRPRMAKFERPISVEDFIVNNKDSMKQLRSPWKHFIDQNRLRHAEKMRDVKDKEVQVLETMFEVIYSEYSYLQNLKTIIEYPKSHAHELANLSDYDRRTLFSNIEDIYKLSSTLFSNLVLMFEKDVLMGDLFTILEKHFDFFDPYIRFIKGQNERNKLISNFAFQSLLIAPTKRIGHYPLLLETIVKQIHSLLKTLSEEDETKKSFWSEKLQEIETCLMTARGFANKCNEALEAQINLHELISLKTKLIGNISHLVETNRKIHRQVEVRGKKFTSQILHDVHLKMVYRMFLLTDMLLIVKHKTKKDKFELVSHAKLINIRYQRGVRESNFFDWADELSRQSMANSSIIILSEPGNRNIDSTIVKFIITFMSKEDEDKFLVDFRRLQDEAKLLAMQGTEDNRRSFISISSQSSE